MERKTPVVPAAPVADAARKVAADIGTPPRKPAMQPKPRLPTADAIA